MPSITSYLAIASEVAGTFATSLPADVLNPAAKRTSRWGRTPYLRLTSTRRTRRGERRALTISRAISGLGLVWLLDFIVAGPIAEGRLEPALDDIAIVERPITALYLPDRHLAPKLRLFIDFLAGLFAEGKLRP